MMADSGSFKNRYLSSKYVDFWMADKGMEAGRNIWRQKLISFLPFEPTDALRVLDLGAGTGALSLALLNIFPNLSLTCLDFSEAMLSHARQQLTKFEGKVTFVQSNLRGPDWMQTIKGTYDGVVSSFVTHTIPDRVKELYQEVFRLLNPSGCFLSCDVFSPPGSELERIYHKSRLVDFQYLIKTKTGVEKSLQEVEQLLSDRSKSYKTFFEKSDKIFSVGAPTVMNHLEWLKEAGFDEVDCLWKHARNAIVGGFRNRS
ncbi:MAG: methyltransferase domain-containing protein [Candidatus Bathyarchaeia archaeon]|jgi:tRNA (cmo5U34)-methyltransferase